MPARTDGKRDSRRKRRAYTPGPRSRGDRARRRANAFGRTRERGKRETSTAGPPHEAECEAVRAGSAGELRAPPARAVPRRWPHKKAASDEPGRARRTCRCSGNSRRGANTGRGWRWREHVSICTDPRPGAAKTLLRYRRRQHLGSRADPLGAARPWPRCRLEHVEESDRALRQPRRPAGGRGGRGRAGTRKKRPRCVHAPRAAVLERAACESRRRREPRVERRAQEEEAAARRGCSASRRSGGASA